MAHPASFAAVLKVSVIVPVYNPGSNMDDLVRSVLNQSLPTTEYEAIFVDDGSTDGTGERLDLLAADHDHVRVEHIPNSGWPSRPRNVGTDMARGEYVLYADNDDYLAPEALERLYQRAVADRADVVVGKVVGHDKFVARELFTENRSGITVEWPPLIRLLSPHKLFRRALLDEHRIRFPEDTRRLEDHVFVMRAFFAAEDRISVLADYPCYHWMLRPAKDNASFAKMEPVSYFDSLRQVLDVIDANAHGRERERLLAHWYRSKALWRLTGAVFLRRDEDFNRAIYDEVRRITAERFPPEIDRFLPAAIRVRSHLVRTDSLEGIYGLSRFEAGLRSHVRVTRLVKERDHVELALDARLRGLRFRKDGDRLLWEPPEELRPHLAGADLDFTVSTSRGHVTPLMRAVADKVEVVLDADIEVRHRDLGDGLITPVVGARVQVEGLDPGEWQLVVPVRISGLNHTAMTVRRGENRAAPLTFTVRRDGTFSRPSWARRHLSGRAPRVARAVRRVARRR
jgi:glycosyltransferase involved in cell wall biosynthesis